MKKYQRRQFLTLTLTSLAGALIPRRLTATNPLIKPPRLKAGSGVGLISPAGATFIKDQVAIVEEAITALGLAPYRAPHILDRYGYLAGSDQDRANDVNQFFADSKIDLLLPITGGWGCARLLPYLDYKTIQKNPKILLGFSDLTALLLAIYAKTGLVTFHGPNGLSSWRTQQVRSFRQVLFDAQRITIRNQPHGDDADRLMQTKNRIQIITPGKTRGRLIGGNLSVLSAILGSPYVPDFRGAILFVEDIGESIYRIDRLLTHLKLTGILEVISGFIFGQCTNCLPVGGYGSLTLEEVMSDHIKPLGIPAWAGAQIGHLENILTLPIGLEVEIDANTGTITYLESGVI